MEKDWRILYELLGEARPPLQLKVLDTVVFDSLALHKPLFKLFTEGERVCCVNLRGTSVDGVVQDVLATSAAIVAVRSTLKLNAAVREKLALCSKGSARYLLDLPGLASLAVAHASGFDGLTLLRKPGCVFAPQVYVHDSSTIRVRALSGEELKVSCSPEVETLIQEASATLRDKVQEVCRQKPSQLVVCYRLDETHRAVWLLSVERCILEPRLRSESRLTRTMSVVQLDKTSIADARQNRSWLRPARSRPALMQRKPLPQRQASRLRGWAQVRDLGNHHVVHLVDSSFLQHSHTLSRLEPFFDFAPSRAHRQVLKPNLSAFADAAFKVTRKTRSKVVTASQDTELERSLKEAHSGAACGSVCAGDFCNLDAPGFQQPPSFQEDARFLVLEGLVTAARTAEFSPLQHVSLQQIRPFKWEGKPLKEVNTPFDVAKLVTQNEAVQLAVCLKCYLVYYNVQEAVLARLLSEQAKDF